MPGNILGSSEDVGLSRDPVDVLVVKASREAAGGIATDLEGQTDKVNNTKIDLDCEVAGSFNHAAGEAGASVSSHRLKKGNCLRIFRFRWDK